MVQGVGALCGDSAVLGWMRGTVTVTECVDDDTGHKALCPVSEQRGRAVR